MYREIITLNKNIVLQSLDPNDTYYIGGTIIEGQMNEPVLNLGENSGSCEIAGVTLRAGSVGIMGTGTNATIRNCRIIDNVGNGIELSFESKPNLLGSLVTANGGNGIMMHDTTYGRHTLYCEPIIKKCCIVDNEGAGVVGGRPMIVDSVIEEK